MPHERLPRTATPFHRVEYVVGSEIFGTEHHVGVIQPEIEVADNHPVAALCKLHAEITADRRFSDAALSRCYDDFPCHI